ncbi:predicted protein [Micromonas commoda]|uniref:Uncharacterized protein n=1 Tax=Micromonas commoda (strain RCC299 / NOUM17 / CCMP2709) TaxID=296587 RepID=C1E765_MICCC|nr:predicted protein [Micromonas commoda]ACO63553.1 predicted protein [Micromonas commoda]|eukprot:XP_002502295.1 predicted protein [Micromonas commoda]
MGGWTPALVCASLALFIAAGVCEVGGGWLVWQSLREGKPWWWGLCGSVVLVLYGFIPCMQPISDFGRVYAVYGGFFIALSYLWGYGLDGFKPDVGDVVGSAVCLIGVLIVMLWPRDGGGLEADGDAPLAKSLTRLAT